MEPGNGYCDGHLKGKGEDLMEVKTYKNIDKVIQKCDESRSYHE